MPKPARFPKTQEIVTNEILRYHGGLNAQAFSGATNPSDLWRIFMSGWTNVFPYYREIEEKDTAISSALETRRLLVLARGWQVTSADDAAGEANEIQEEASRFLQAIPNFNFALEELLDAPAYGYAVSEIMWENDGTEISVSKIIGRPQEYFRFGKDQWDPQLGDLHFLPDQFNPTLVPAEKFLVNTYKPRHGDRRGLPLLRRLFWASWFKRQCLRLYLQFSEKGQGTVVVRYADGANDDEKTKAQEVAQAIVDEMAVGVPKSLEVIESLLASARVRHGEDFSRLIDYLDAEMTRLILGQTLTTRGAEQGVGTQALGQVHENLMHEIIKRDAKAQDEVVNEQLLRPWGVWMFGEKFLDRNLRPTYATTLTPEHDAMEQANLLSKARGMIDIPLEEAYARFGIRRPEVDENGEQEELVKESMFPMELGGGLGGVA